MDYSVSVGDKPIGWGGRLVVDDLGPWRLQRRAKGSEVLTAPTLPGRGYWRLDDSADVAQLFPTTPYVHNADPSNLGGVVPSGGITIGPTTLPAGTKVCRFLDLSAGQIYAQGIAGKWAFLGNRWRLSHTNGVGLYNDPGATWTCYDMFGDYGGVGFTDATPHENTMKFLGGSGHVVYRTYITLTGTGIQPNVHDVSIMESWIDDIIYYFGDLGPSGTGDNYHLNGISCEGGAHGMRLLRNHIHMPSPDLNGRPTPQTDCIALFQSNGLGYDDVQVIGNDLGGAGYPLYAGGGAVQSTNVAVTDNTFTTKWWTNSGANNPMAADPGFGANGNVSARNYWADDYGTGGDGLTPTSSRQYPNGDGPRTRTPVF